MRPGNGRVSVNAFHRGPWRGRGELALALGLWAVVASGVAHGIPGRLSVRTFGVEEGLAHVEVRRIVIDSRGFLWLCTFGGLTRFDGQQFRSFGPSDGLAGPAVNDLVEDTGRGLYWVATSAGLFRLAQERTAAEAPLFEPVSLPVEGAVLRLLLDRDGRLWIGTVDGLARFEGSGDSMTAGRVLPEDGVEEGSPAVLAVLEDEDGSIWAGTQGHGLYHLGADGRLLRHHPPVPGLNFIRDLRRGPDGRIWCTYFGGVARLHANPDDPDGPVERRLEPGDGLPSGDTSQMLVDTGNPEGEILVGSVAGVARLAPDGEGKWTVRDRWTTEDGLTSDAVRTFAIDPAGSLWLGTVARGAQKLRRTFFRQYPDIEEPGTVVVGLDTDGSAGMLALASVGRGRYRLHHLTAEGDRATSIRLPADVDYLGWGNQRLRRDPAGNLWIATGRGLFLYPPGGASGTRGAPRRYGPEAGLPGPDIFWVSLDVSGRLWVSVSPSGPGAASLAWREPGASSFTTLPDGVGGAPGELAWGFAEAEDGSFWVSFTDGALVRADRGGTVTSVPVDPRPPGPAALAFDRRGRLWLLSRGVRVADVPRATTARFRPGPAALEDIATFCLVEDAEGRLLFGTERGVLRLDERSGAVRLYTRADGLPGESIVRCARDDAGGLWFGDVHGLARLEQGPEPELPAPRAQIAAVQVDGGSLGVPVLGASEVGPFRLAPGPHRVAVQFFAIGHAPGTRLRFQHRFATGAAWSTPSEARTLEFPRLGPGTHRLLVRAVPEQGDPAPAAELRLEIPPPLVQRGWFLGLVAVLLAGTAYAAYRLRLEHVLAVERVRTRIATDLHDDVGADLSRIALLADFAHRDVGERPDRTATMLEDVARTARDAVAGMSDIIWALKPQRDNLGQVVARLRDLAAELAAPAGIALTVEAENGLEAVHLTGEQRRDLYRLLKEALINAIRHAGARAIGIVVRLPERRIVVEIRDDGTGFEPGSRDGGDGLGNMHARAERLGGRLHVDTVPGGGTTVRVEFPGT